MTQGDDSAPTPNREPGVIATARRLGVALIGIIHTRLDLLSTEIEEDTLRAWRLVQWWLLSLFFLSGGVLLLTAFVLILLWDEHPLAALGTCAALYLVAGTGLMLAVRRSWRTKPKLFAATLAELTKDIRRLKP